VKGFIGNVLDCIDVCLFCTVRIMSRSGYWGTGGIVSRSGYWGTGGMVTIVTQISIKETVFNKFVVDGC
jgi:hypothetical protein